MSLNRWQTAADALSRIAFRDETYAAHSDAAFAAEVAAAHSDRRDAAMYMRRRLLHVSMATAEQSWADTSPQLSGGK
jgi:hypothetical protein